MHFVFKFCDLMNSSTLHPLTLTVSDCGNPNIANADFSGETFYTGTASITCHAGYDKGAGSLTCQNNGNWATPKITCDPKGTLVL